MKRHWESWMIAANADGEAGQASGRVGEWASWADASIDLARVMRARAGGLRGNAESDQRFTERFRSQPGGRPATFRVPVTSSCRAGASGHSSPCRAAPGSATCGRRTEHSTKCSTLFRRRAVLSLCVRVMCVTNVALSELSKRMMPFFSFPFSLTKIYPRLL
jgi:hypothetical protein